MCLCLIFKKYQDHLKLNIKHSKPDLMTKQPICHNNRSCNKSKIVCIALGSYQYCLILIGWYHVIILSGFQARWCCFESFYCTILDGWVSTVKSLLFLFRSRKNQSLFLFFSLCFYIFPWLPRKLIGSRIISPYTFKEIHTLNIYIFISKLEFQKWKHPSFPISWLAATAHLLQDASASP